MVIKVGEDFEKEFNRELENYTTKVRRRSKGGDSNPNTHLRWSERVGSFGLLRVFGVPLPSTSVLVALLSQMMCEINLGAYISVNDGGLARVKTGGKSRLRVVRRHHKGTVIYVVAHLL